MSLKNQPVGTLRNGKTYHNKSAVNIEELEDSLQFGSSQEYTLQELSTKPSNSVINSREPIFSNMLQKIQCPGEPGEIISDEDNMSPFNSTTVEGGASDRWGDNMDQSAIVSDDISVHCLNEDDEVLIQNQYNSVQSNLFTLVSEKRLCSIPEGCELSTGDAGKGRVGEHSSTTSEDNLKKNIAENNVEEVVLEED